MFCIELIEIQKAAAPCQIADICIFLTDDLRQELSEIIVKLDIQIEDLTQMPLGESLHILICLKPLPVFHQPAVTRLTGCTEHNHPLECRACLIDDIQLFKGKFPHKSPVLRLDFQITVPLKGA